MSSVELSPPPQPSMYAPRIEIFLITCCIGGIFFATTISLIVIICCCKFNKLNDEVILTKLSSVNVDETQDIIGQTTATSTSDSMQTQQYHQSIKSQHGNSLQLTPISNPLNPAMITTQTAHNLMQQLQTLQFLLQQQIAKENTINNNGFNSIDNNIYHHSINNHSINNSFSNNNNNYSSNQTLVKSASVQPQIDILPQRQRRLSVDNSPFNTNVPIKHHLNLHNTINNNDNNPDIDNQLQFLEYLELQRLKSAQKCMLLLCVIKKNQNVQICK